jgi:hypothetical protein
MLSVIYAKCHLCEMSFMPSDIYANCGVIGRFAECYYAECRYAECLCAKCLG